MVNCKIKEKCQLIRIKFKKKKKNHASWFPRDSVAFLLFAHVANTSHELITNQVDAVDGAPEN